MKILNKPNILIITLLSLFTLYSCSESSSSNSSSSTGNSVTITVENDIRTITSNGIPDHGLDPDTSYANTLSEQTLVYTMDATPVSTNSITSYAEPNKFGVATNGIPLDPFTAEYFNNDRNSGWHIDATGGNLGLDKYGGHIQPDGTYHYHSVKTDFFTAFDIDSSEHSPIVGYAADGFPVYAKYVYSNALNASSNITELQSNYQLKTGTRPNGPGGSYDGTYIEDYEFVESLNSDLNEASARYGVTPEYPEGTWYYVMTSNFPYIPIKFIGTPDNSFSGGMNTNFRYHHHSHPH